MPRLTRKPRRAARAPRAPAGRGTGLRSRAAGWLRRLVILGIVAVLCVGAYAARRPLLVGAGRLLIVRDQLRPADAILLLAGDLETRPEEAARLYRRHLAPRILIAREQDSPSTQLGVRPNWSDLDVTIMERLGVPASAITVLRFPGGTTSTYDEARAFREWAYNARPRTVIVVTHPFHTRRARWLVRGQLARLGISVLMDPVHHWRYTEQNWWTTEAGLIDFFEEFPKFLHEWTRD